MLKKFYLLNKNMNYDGKNIFNNVISGAIAGSISL